jgi:RNA 2',3'-cyclic 3'-phosphodiesterase
LRCFLAFPIPDEIREELIRICHGFPNTSWTKPENFHITIQFFPDLDESQIELLQSLLQTFSCPNISTLAKGLGYFKHPRRNVTIWLGLEGREVITQYRNKIVEILKPQGFAIEKRYEPHLTLGRCKSFLDNKWQAYFESFLDFETSQFSIRDFVLYQSTLSPKGSIYEELIRFS